MNLERLRTSLRRSREIGSLETAVELGVLPADALRRLEEAGEDPTAEALVRRGLVAPEDLGRLRRWAEQLERAALLALRLPPDVPAEVVARLRVPDALVGRYVLVEPLGEGGMGAVHRAWDTDLSRWVALKLLSGARDPDARERFLREARTAARLDHPGIVTVYEAGQAGDACFIAMKLVEGRSLHGLRPSPREAARLIRDAALAVHDAHLHGIVHRDLKPGNLLLDRSDRVFVGDFGIAREIRVDSRLTASGSLLGTPAYMAPEQARDDRSAVGPATDVYGLGATLYELLSGAPPFQDDNLYDLLTKVVQADAPPLSGDRDLAVVAAQCLEKDPARRYVSAAALAEDLCRYLDGEPLAARTPGPLERLRRAAARRPMRAAGTAVFLLLLAGVGAWSATAAARRAEADRTADRAWDEAQGSFARRDYGRTMEAIGVYLSLRPGSEAARHLRTDCERALEEQRKEAALKQSVAEAAELLRRAVEHVKEAKALWRVRTARREQWEPLFEAALRAADAASARYPGLPGGLYTRGEVLQARGRWREAIAAFDAALAMDATLPEAYFRRGLCRLSMYAEERAKRDGVAGAERHKDAALADLRKYASLRGLEEDADPEVRYARAAIAYAEGRNEEAVAACDRLLAEIPSDERVWLLKSEALIGRERNHEAVEVLEQLISGVMPQMPEAHHMRGVARMGLGDARGALGDFERFLALDPASTCGLTDLGWAKGELGDFEGEIEATSRVIAADPSNARAWAQRGWARGERGDHAGKVADCTRALELDPANASACNYRGVARMHLEDGRGALEDLDRAVELDPRNAEYFGNRAHARLKTGDPGGALEDIDRALDLAPDRHVHYQARAYIRASLRDWAQAEADMDRALARAPGNAGYHRQRGHYRYHQKKWSGAVADYSAALKPDPDRVDLLLERADAAWKGGDLDRAFDDASRAIALEPRNIGARVARMAVRAHRNDWDGLIVDATKALELEPGHLTALHNRGGARFKKGDYKGAVDDFSAILEQQPGRVDTLTGRGLARGRLGDWPGAMEDCTKAVELDPKSPLALLNRGWVKGNLKDYEGEIEDCGKALALNPAYAEAYENRAWAHGQRGDRRGEIDDWTRLIELQPRNPERHAQRARARFKADDPAGAIEDFGRAIELSPKNAGFHVDRGRARLKSGDPAGAGADFRRALELKPSLEKELTPLLLECESKRDGR